MLRQLLSLLIALLVLGAVVRAEANDARKRHPWGRFSVGSWKRVRVRKETFDEQGKLAGTSIEEAKTTLISADDEKYTLEILAHVKAAGREFDAPKKTLSLTYYGSIPGQEAIVKTITESATLELEGRTITCQLVEVKVETEMLRRVTKMYLSNKHDVPLRMEATTIQMADGSVLSQTQSDVKARNMLHLILGEQRPTSMVQTLRRRPQTIQHTFELHCSQVPGGVIAAWSNQTDKEGRILERFSLEILDFSVPSVPLAPKP